MKRDDIALAETLYDITPSMITERANVHSRSGEALFRFDKISIMEFAMELIACARGAQWPLLHALPWHHSAPAKVLRDRAARARPGAPAPEPESDTYRLNLLEAAGGHVAGSDGGRPAFRILGFDTWHPTLRQAIDAIAKPKDSITYEDVDG